MTYNLIIRFLLITYIKVWTTFGFNMELKIRNSAHSDPDFVMISYLLLMLALVLPPFVAWLMYKMRDHSHKLWFSDRIGILYEALHKYKDKRNLMYFPWFLVRRGVFIIIPSFIPYPWLQI